MEKYWTLESININVGVKMSKDIKVLMIGPARNVKGGMTSVVDNYYKAGLNKKVNIKYIETINDKSKIEKLLKEVLGYIEFLKNIKKFDIVHVHMASGRSTYRKCHYINIAKKNNKKVVLHVHGGGFKEFFEKECSNKQKKFIMNTFNKCDKIIVLSHKWKEYFSQYISSDKIKIVYNGVKIPQDYEKKLNAKKIIFLGRISRDKGIYDLLKAMSYLVGKYNDIELTIGGIGEEKKLYSLIEKYNLKNNVKILGWLNEEKKCEELKKSSLFILPSYFEAMPISILEAMSYKNVIISTNVGGIPEIIDNGREGILIEPGNIKQLYATIERFINNEYDLKKFSEEAMKKVKKYFDINESISEIYKIYDLLIEK